MHTYPNTVILYHKSNMLLHVDSDAAYLVLSKAQSRVAGYFQLTNHRQALTFFTNGAILIKCKTLRHVVELSAAAEVGGIFHDAQVLDIHNQQHPSKPTILLHMDSFRKTSI